MDTFEEAKMEIDDIVGRAKQVIDPLLAPTRKVIEDIKSKLAGGTDMIPTAVINEWTLVLGITLTELTAYKDAYALTSALWKVNIDSNSAQSLIARRPDQKKVDRILDARIRLGEAK